MTDAYERLAKYLDTLPASYPPAPDGVELRLLEHLFTPQEAKLALHLSLIDQDIPHISRQAGLSVEEASVLLAKMLKKGLINGSQSKDKGPTYSISQFVIGFYEGQVNQLDKDTIELFEAYAPYWFEKGSWKKVPQLRTIPVMQAIPITSEVLPYMQIEEIIRSKKDIAVRNCVCRQEQQLIGKGCSNPIETCMTFDGAARSTVENGIGRMISVEEAMDIIEEAQIKGLVLQPSNSKNPIVLCICCSCCCGVLRHIKADPNPGSLVANPFVTNYDQLKCISCAVCVDICPMEALTLDDLGYINFAQNRCIGCGLCVGVCPSSALQLVLREEPQQPKIPRNTAGTYLNLAKARGLDNVLANLWIILRSFLKKMVPK